MVDQNPHFLKPLAHTPTKTDLFEYINSELDGRTWFAGDKLTAADIMMSFPMEAAAARSGLDARYPNALAYIKRLHERRAYQEALRKGGALEILGTKT